MNQVPMPVATPFQGFYQLAYVTTDLSLALDLFADRYGVPEFADLGEVALALDDGGETRIRLALSFVGALQLEIIEPRGGRDGLYRDALPADGFGLVWHHVGFKVPSPDALERARRELVRGGHEIVLGGGNLDTAAFFYADARASLGHYVEYIYLSPARQEFHHRLPHH